MAESFGVAPIINRGIVGDWASKAVARFEGDVLSHHPDTLVSASQFRNIIKDTSRDVPLSANLQIRGRRLTASGEFDIRQSDFGINPFRAALGTLKVQDQLHVKFRMIADRAGSE
jgi:hypothetical protein